jgi:PAS domain S-box-containing protein
METKYACISVSDDQLKTFLTETLTKYGIKSFIGTNRLYAVDIDEIAMMVVDESSLSEVCSYIKSKNTSNLFIPVLAISLKGLPAEFSNCITDIITDHPDKEVWRRRINTYISLRNREVGYYRKDKENAVFKSFLKNFPLPAFLVDRKLNIYHPNNFILNEKRFNQLGFFEKKCYEVIVNSGKVCKNCPVPEVFKQKKVIKEVVEVKQEDGTVNYYERIAAPVFDDNGKINFVAVVINDITEQKQSELALKQSRDNYNSFVENTTDLVILINNKGLIKYTNNQITRYGYTKEEVNGKPMILYIPEKDHVRAMRVLSKVLNDNINLTIETSIINKNGLLTPVLASGVKIVYDGESVDLVLVKDISTLKKIEDDLRKSNETFLNLFNNSVTAIYIQDRDGIFIDVNKAAVKLYGYNSKKDLIGKSPADLSDNSKNDLDKLKEYLELVYNGTPQTFEFWGKRVDGTSFPKLVTVEKGSYFGKDVFFSYAIEISDLIEAREKLRESEEKYRTIFQTSPDAIAINKLDTTFVEVNDTFLKIFNTTNERVVGKNPFYAGLFVTPENRRRLINSLQQTGIAQNLEFSINTNNGKTIETIISTRRININGEPHVLSIIKDISKLKETEKAFKERDEHYRAIVENISDGLYIYDGKSLLFVNDRLANILGYEKEEMFKKDVWEFFHPEDRERIKQNAYNRLKGKDVPTTFPSRVICKDGTVKNGDFTVRTIVYQGKQTIMGVVRDVTERIKAEALLVEAKEKAEENSRLKSAFLNNMNHELRTPMNAIMGFSDLMDKAEPEQKEQFAGIIRNSSKQLLQLMDDVLYLSRLQSEKLPVKNSFFSPLEVVSDVVRMIELANDNNRVSVILSSLNNDSGLIIFADEAKIRQILTNFASNAIKHTFEGTVEIGFFVEDKEIEFYVKDTGLGIPQEEQPYIFEPFYRGKQSTNAAIRGTGLGLSIAKQLAALMDGEIGVSSDLGRGSYFYLTIPLRKKKKISNNNTPNNADKVFKGWDNITALVAEDDPANYLFLEILLKNKIKKLDHAWNGKDAVSMVEQNNYDIVLMDIKMPVMDGIEATKLIKQKYPELPVIAQTAYSHPEEKKKIMESGCDDFLAKPINKKVLFEIIEKYVKE